MMRLRYSQGFYTLLALALPWPERFAAAGGWDGGRCLIFMAGHAGVLHYAVNALGWLMLWRVATVGRTLAAWAFSALCAALLPLDEPVLGWSCIIYYYLGLCLAGMPRARRRRLLAVTVAGFFLPHVAAGMHAALLAIGWLMRKLEVAWERTR